MVKLLSLKVNHFTLKGASEGLSNLKTNDNSSHRVLLLVQGP